jgi:hypothetical protein
MIDGNPLLPMMRAFLAALIALAVTAAAAVAGNTSSNSSSNTSSDSGSHGSSYRHSHNWSVDSDDGRRRRVLRGSTRIERYAPPFDRSYRMRRFHERDDD